MSILKYMCVSHKCNTSYTKLGARIMIVRVNIFVIRKAQAVNKGSQSLESQIDVF